MVKNFLDEDEEQLYSAETPVYDPSIDPAGEVDEERLLAQDFTNSENAFSSPVMDMAQPIPEPVKEAPMVAPEGKTPNDLMSRREQLLAQYKSLKPSDIYNDDDLKQAQEDRLNQHRMLAISEAGQGISSAVARRYGGDTPDNTKQFENFRKMADMGVSNLEERMKAQKEKRSALTEEIKGSDDVVKRDPTSRISQLMRKLAAKRGIEVPEDSTAHDLENILTKIEKPQSASGRRYQRMQYTAPDGTVKIGTFDTLTGQIATAEQDLAAGFAPRMFEDKHDEEKKVLQNLPGMPIKSVTGPKMDKATNEQTGQSEFTQGNLTAKQDKDLKHVQEKFLSDVSDDRGAVNAAISVKDMLAAGGKMNGDILRAVQNQLARATGEKGAMTEQDVAPFGGTQAILDRVGRFVKYNAVGEMPDADREFLTKVSEVLAKKSNENIARRSNFFSEQLHRDWSTDGNTKGIAKENVQKLLGVDSAQMSDNTPPPQGKVRVKNPNGKVGLIPVENLKKALESGYTEVK